MRNRCIISSITSMLTSLARARSAARPANNEGEKENEETETDDDDDDVMRAEIGGDIQNVVLAFLARPWLTRAFRPIEGAARWGLWHDPYLRRIRARSAFPGHSKLLPALITSPARTTGPIGQRRLLEKLVCSKTGPPEEENLVCPAAPPSLLSHSLAAPFCSVLPFPTPPRSPLLLLPPAPSCPSPIPHGGAQMPCSVGMAIITVVIPPSHPQPILAKTCSKVVREHELVRIFTYTTRITLC